MSPTLLGNVYQAKGGRPGPKGATRYWLVVASHGNVVHMLGLNDEHEVVSSTSYGKHVLCGRELLAHVKMPVDLSKPIDFEPVMLGQKIDWVA